MRGNDAAENADRAIEWLMNFELRELESAISNDYARWHMESAILIYDWCHDRMREAQRQDRIDYFNHALRLLFKKNWGHDPMPANNYFQGYLRNAIEWVIATHDENPAAEELCVKYVGHRLGNVLLPYYNHGGGRGGTPAEGGQYGVYMIDYSLIPYATLRDYLPGKADVFERTNFFAENFY